MNTITHLRIVSVDLDGFQGRENHPEPEHVGQIVTVHAMAVEPLEDAGASSARPFAHQDAIGVWTVELLNGRFLTLVDHEVEIVPAPVQ